MKANLILSSRSIILTGLLSCLSIAGAQHTAYVFNTGGAALPAELKDAIKAHGGPDTVIEELGPNTTGSIKGVRVYDMGLMTLPRYDLGPGTGNPPAPEARHFIVAGDLNLTYEQSIWGWGNRLLKIEVLNNANLAAGVKVSTAAVGRLGGPGAGDGGKAEYNPAFNFYRYGDFTTYTAAPGGVLGSLNGGGGTDGNPVMAQQKRYPLATPEYITPIQYVSTNAGGDGTTGQGDRYFHTVPVVIGGATFYEEQLSVCKGGADSTFNGDYPGGGTGGNGGAPGYSGLFSSNGFNGNPGNPGGNGVNGLSGKNGALMTRAGSAIHLRGGSGGGAGATGGYGMGGRTGGCGGGGGASGTDMIFPATRRGGAGGIGGRGGDGGAAGLGGDGGGGGGGLQFIVRGTFTNEAAFSTAGGNGIPGQPGGTGTDGADGTDGAQGQQDFGPVGGNGGKGGKGGRGGDGGKGGNGSGGSGGNLQIAAGIYYQPGGSLNAAGGAGSPAGLVQIHSFNGMVQNAPFGTAASGPNRYRSYHAPESLYADPAISPAWTPYLPVTGGAATSGLTIQNTVSGIIIAALQAPAHAAAAAVRMPASAFFSDMPNYDLIVFTSLKPGMDVRGPRLSLINPGDTTSGGVVLSDRWAPDGPQVLLYNIGDASNPAFVPGASGPTVGSIPWSRGFVTLVDKGKPFELTAEYGPYEVLRTFKATPALANPGVAGGYANSAVLLYDKGRIRSTLIAETGPNAGAVLSETDVEYHSNFTGTVFARTGGTTRIRCAGVNTGNSWSVAQGRYKLSYADSTGPVMIDQTYAGIAGGQSVWNFPVLPAATGSPNTSVQIAEFQLLPDYDSAAGQQIIKQTVSANLLGPVSTFTGLNPTAGGPGIYFAASSVQPLSRNFQVTNASPVRAEWESVAAANPLLTRLGIVSAVITGPNASAFSVNVPASVERGASAGITVNFIPAAAGSYSAALRLTTDEGVLNSTPGRVIEFPLLALIGVTENYDTWALSLPDGKRGKNDDGDGDGISNFIAYGLRRGSDTAAAMPWLTRTLLPGGQQSTRMQFDLPELDRPDVRWSISGSADMQNWEVLARRNAAGAWSLLNPADVLSETLSGGSRRVSLTRQDGSARLLLKLNADSAMSNVYTNDFSTAPRAILLGYAVHDAGSLRLTAAENGQTGAAILDMEAWPNQTGFSAAFDLTMGPGTPVPADGISFVVGETGDYEWGETGPETARNLTISFDTFSFNAGAAISRGFRIQVNGGVVVYQVAQPFTNGASVPVEVTYTPLEGVTLRYNGATIFANVPVPGFTLQAGDRFGFGGRTGGYNQLNRVDNVTIGPR